jgi:choline-glycine betaine transporter
MNELTTLLQIVLSIGVVCAGYSAFLITAFIESIFEYVVNMTLLDFVGILLA